MDGKAMTWQDVTKMFASAILDCDGDWEALSERILLIEEAMAANPPAELVPLPEGAVVLVRVEQKDAEYCLNGRWLSESYPKPFGVPAGGEPDWVAVIAGLRDKIATLQAELARLRSAIEDGIRSLKGGTDEDCCCVRCQVAEKLRAALAQPGDVKQETIASLRKRAEDAEANVRAMAERVRKLEAAQ